MKHHISSMAFLHDNQGAFISDIEGNIKMVKWQAGANSEDEFDFSVELKKVGYRTYSICLTKDDKYLLAGSNRLVSILEAETREVIKEIKLTDYVRDISLIKDYKHAMITEYNGNLCIINLETLEISSVAENITNDIY